MREVGRKAIFFFKKKKDIPYKSGLDKSRKKDKKKSKSTGVGFEPTPPK